MGDSHCPQVCREMVLGTRVSHHTLTMDFKSAAIVDRSKVSWESYSISDLETGFQVSEHFVILKVIGRLIDTSRDVSISMVTFYKCHWFTATLFYYGIVTNNFGIKITFSSVYTITCKEYRNVCKEFIIRKILTSQEI